MLFLIKNIVRSMNIIKDCGGNIILKFLRLGGCYFLKSSKWWVKVNLKSFTYVFKILASWIVRRSIQHTINCDGLDCITINIFERYRDQLLITASVAVVFHQIMFNFKLFSLCSNPLIRTCKRLLLFKHNFWVLNLLFHFY